ncbi:MAG: DNA helicase II, partial [Oceanococcaceae bacterium]
MPVHGLSADDLSPILDGLNPDQHRAVTAPLDHRLILAGAGSGKTRVLTHRIAWLLQVEGVSPWSVLAVTFTNKAAAEMRARLARLIGGPAEQMWVGTFHGIAHRLLRRHWEAAGLPQSFQILDADDQLRFIKRLLKASNRDEGAFPPKSIVGFINRQKEEGLRPEHVDDSGDFSISELRQVYAEYEEARLRAGVVDFAELLLRAHELCRDEPEIQAQYRRRFSHILVDEFQDTNKLQYAWLRVLAGSTGKVFGVGDDDQSIYSFRGAQVGNMLSFERDFPGADLIRLEQNYRSTGHILGAANGLISGNASRLGKQLWTEAGEGQPVQIFAAYNDHEEADYVLGRIRRHVDEGGARADCAILYRSNAQSRLFEERLVRERIPYRVYGGLRFFERAEIKDALAYLRLTDLRDDDTALERVINLPTRGIGASTLDKIRACARAERLSLWRAAEKMAVHGLPAKAGRAVLGFLQLIEDLARQTADLPLHETVQHVVEATGLLEFHGKAGSDRGEAKKENLEELANAARGFELAERPQDEEDLPPLTAFLTHAALEAGEAQGEAWEDCVQLMTLHSAKGLEFPVVFLVGMEDGLFPHQRSVETVEGMEEERRLAYVGMTRARQELHISHAESRLLHGSLMRAHPSRFLPEIPAAHTEEVRPSAPRMSTGPRLSTAGLGSPGLGGTGSGRLEESRAGLKVGQGVRHARFGEGVVLELDGDGERARVHVQFRD